MDLIGRVERIVKDRSLCLNCLGRLFAGLSFSLSNRERGEALIRVLSMALSEELMEGRGEKAALLERLAYLYDLEGVRRMLLERGYPVKERKRSPCEICGDLFSRLDEAVERILEEIEGYEFQSYQVGVRLPKDIEEREDRIRATYGLKYSESIRGELSREIGKALEKRIPGKIFSPNPDLKIDINPYTGTVKVSPRRVTVKGRIYLEDPGGRVFAKVCQECRGRGCPACEYTGRVDEASVEYILGRVLLNLFGAKRWRFGMKYRGERVIDFTISLITPKKRYIPGERIVEEVNRLGGGGFTVEDVRVE